MRQTAPGRYEADFPLDRYGSFLLHASLEKGVDDGKGGHEERAGRRELRPRDEPVPARVPRARARPRHALAHRARHRRHASIPDAKAVFDPAGETIRYHQDLWSRFIGAAIAVFLLDLLIRRVRIFDRKKTVRPSTAK